MIETLNPSETDYEMWGQPEVYFDGVLNEKRREEGESIGGRKGRGKRTSAHRGRRSILHANQHV